MRTSQGRNGAVGAWCVSDQRFIYSPWRPVVGRTDRQEKDENSKDLAGDRK